MTKSPHKNVPDVAIELGATIMPSRHASDRATAPDLYTRFVVSYAVRSKRMKSSKSLKSICSFSKGSVDVVKIVLGALVGVFAVGIMVLIGALIYEKRKEKGIK